MRRRLLRTIGLLLLGPFFAGPSALQAQAAAPPLPVWQVESPLFAEAASPLRTPVTASFIQLTESRRTRSHTLTGLLIGGLVGGAVTALFLSQFCSGPDAACGANEVGRAAVVFAVPAAAAGALIGFLIRTEH